MKADLHTHTVSSDGRLTAGELFQKAKEKGLDHIAITDHDVCENVCENRRLAKIHEVGYLRGIELSTLHRGKSVHILGYFKKENHDAKGMRDYYTYMREGREKRARKFVHRLKKHFGLDITYERLMELSDGIIARPHMAKAIRELYPAYSHEEVFDKFLGEHSKAYVPATELSTEAGLALLHKHDILAVLAHPTLLKEEIRNEVLSMPFDGIEAFYSENKEGEGEHFEAFAKERNMLVTAGSDYHGIRNDSSHGDLGDVVLEGKRLELFLEALNS